MLTCLASCFLAGSSTYGGVGENTQGAINQKKFESHWQSWKIWLLLEIAKSLVEGVGSNFCSA